MRGPATSKAVAKECRKRCPPILPSSTRAAAGAAGQVKRVEILLRYHGGETVSGIAGTQCTNWPRMERCITNAPELGVRGALQDLP